MKHFEGSLNLILTSIIAMPREERRDEKHASRGLGTCSCAICVSRFFRSSTSPSELNYVTWKEPNLYSSNSIFALLWHNWPMYYGIIDDRSEEDQNTNA
jgi:hypothetical protein